MHRCAGRQLEDNTEPLPPRPRSARAGCTCPRTRAATCCGPAPLPSPLPHALPAQCGSAPLGCAGHRATEEGPRRLSLPPARPHPLALPGRAGPQPRTVGSRPAFVSRARRRLPEPLCAARPRLSMDVTVSQLVELFLQSPLVTWVSARSGTGDREAPCRVGVSRLPTRERAPVPGRRGGGEGGLTPPEAQSPAVGTPKGNADPRAERAA